MKRWIALGLLIIYTGALFADEWPTVPNESWKDWIDCYYWIRDTIKFVPDKVNYWQKPDETLALRTGDCEDLAILLMAFANTEWNIPSELVILKVVGPDWKETLHMMLVLNVTDAKFDRKNAPGLRYTKNKQDCYLVDFAGYWAKPQYILNYEETYTIKEVVARLGLQQRSTVWN